MAKVTVFLGIFEDYYALTGLGISRLRCLTEGHKPTRQGDEDMVAKVSDHGPDPITRKDLVSFQTGRIVKRNGKLKMGDSTMYKNILLCTDGSPVADVAAEYAVWLAGQIGAHVHALYITDVRILEGPLMADIAGAFGAQPYPGLIPRMQEIQKEKANTILAAAGERCAKAGVPYTVTHETGKLVPLMLEHEKRADLVVIGQRGEHAQWVAEMLGSSVERMVRASIKPCVVTPSAFQPVSRMLVAYDGSVSAKKALETALNLAGTLKSEVIILTACQRETEDEASRFLQEAHAEATKHNVAARTQLAHGESAQQIIVQAAVLEANLIVMGAYGHNRFREWILGSTTSHVLHKANVPVLLTRP
jgi:nucleotide-binding universal stress UspA family protein